jgi:hypothetical protein
MVARRERHLTLQLLVELPSVTEARHEVRRCLGFRVAQALLELQLAAAALDQRLDLCRQDRPAKRLRQVIHRAIPQSVEHVALLLHVRREHHHRDFT